MSCSYPISMHGFAMCKLNYATLLPSFEGKSMSVSSA